MGEAEIDGGIEPNVESSACGETMPDVMAPCMSSNEEPAGPGVG